MEIENSGQNRIRTHDLCDTGAVLYQLSYQAIWELVTKWVHNILTTILCRTIIELFILQVGIFLKMDTSKCVLQFLPTPAV